MQRRNFLILSVNATLWPVASRAQQRAMPVIGFLGSGSPGPFAPYVAEFRRGLSGTGYVEGQNLVVQYHWAEGNYDQLPGMIASLIDRKVHVIVATGVSSLMAKNATSTIPVVFSVGRDPVAFGLVPNLARPGNVTGVTILTIELTPKLIELISELVPNTRFIGLLVNPANSNAERMIGDAQKAAEAKAIDLPILKASSEEDIKAAFTSLVQLRAGALVVGSDPFFASQHKHLVAQAARHALPAIYFGRDIPAAGGLISYGASTGVAYHQVGIYAGRILNGDKPGDLPVHQASKVELIINLNTAKALGLTVPPRLLARADEVIE
jgi:putative ABC transport system substrate-binding protein